MSYTFMSIIQNFDSPLENLMGPWEKIDDPRILNTHARAK